MEPMLELNERSPLLYEESLDELMSDRDGFEPVIPGLAYRGLKTTVVGLSKAGKSFTVWMFATDAVRAGRRIKVLAEDPRDVVLDRLRTFGLTDDYGDGFRVTRRGHEEVRKLKWREIVEKLAEETARERYDAVVIDTLRPWLGLQEGQSDRPEVMGAAIDGLSPICEAGAAVVVIHQAPWDGDRARGSTEIHAASDLLFIVKGEGYGVRSIKYIGGRVDGIEESRNIRWTGTEHQDLGAMRPDKANRVVEVLKAIETATEPMTIEELEDATEFSERSLWRYLAKLEARVLVIRVPGAVIPGEGREPDRWRKPGTFTGMLSDPDGLTEGTGSTGTSVNLEGNPWSTTSPDVARTTRGASSSGGIAPDEAAVLHRQNGERP
jgi:AAA domain